MSTSDWGSVVTLCVWAGAIVGLLGLVAYYQVKNA
jgi:hypothetical protein